MKTTDFVKMSLETSKNFVMALIADMKDAPLTFPTAKGGNHPLWILGHLTLAEASILHGFVLGEENPLAGWKELFDGGTESVADASRYPAFDELVAKFEKVRARTLSVLGGLSDEDLDRKIETEHADLCPGTEDIAARRLRFGTVGKCFMMLSLHPAIHFGQVADARRSLGRKPLFA